MGENHTFQKILLSVDGSKQSLHAAERAAHLAKTQSGELTIPHVIDELTLKELEKLMGSTFHNLLNELEEQGWALLRSTEIMLKKFNVPMKTIIRKGIPHQEILDAASSEEADLIVLGKLGKRGVSKVLLGSTVLRVLKFSRIPVMVVD